MNPDHKPKRAPRRYGLRIAIILLMVPGICAMGWGLSAWINSWKVSPEVRTIPPQLASRHGIPVPPSAVDKIHRPPFGQSLPSYEPYERFLKRACEKDGSLEEPAALYKKISAELEQIKPPGLSPLFEERGEDAWRPGDGPLPEKVSKCVSEHAELSDDLRRLFEMKPLPTPSMKDVIGALSNSTPILFPFSNILPYSCRIRFLAAGGRQRLEDGDASGALNDYLQLIQLLRKYAPIFGRSGFHPASIWITRACRLIVEWLEHTPATEEQENLILGELGTLRNGDALEKSAIMDEIEFQYLFDRQATILEFDLSPWYSPTFGWDPGTPYDSYYFELGRGNNKLPLPRLDRFLADAFRAMQLKQNSSEIIRDSDAEWAKSLEEARGPYPAARAAAERRQTEFVLQKWGRDLTHNPLTTNAYAILDSFLLQPLLARAEVDLLETALRLRENPAKTFAERDGATSKSYWHDPFSEQTLLVDDPTSPTLVWSVGPDAHDQKGEPAFTGATTSGFAVGDIVVDLAKMKN